MGNHQVIKVFDTLFDTIRVITADSFSDTLHIVNVEKSEIIEYLPVIVSGSIGIMALIATMVSIYNNYKNNKKSTEPYLNIGFNLEFPQKMSVSITNKGIGPAILHSMDYYLNGKKIKGKRKICLSTALLQYSNEIAEFGIMKGISHTEGAYIAVGESLDIVKFENTGAGFTTLQLYKFGEILKKIDFVIHYRTIYKEKRHTKSSKSILTQLYE